MTGSAIQNNTSIGGSRGLEVCLRSVPAKPFKNSQPTYSSSFFNFLINVSFVCVDDREISTSEIVTCSLMLHHILTPNVLRR